MALAHDEPALQHLDDLHPRHRRSALTKVTVAWMFGAVWFVAIAGAPFTKFASALGATPWHFGLLAAMPHIATLVSLPASLWIDSSGKRKSIFMVALLTQRFNWFAIGIIPPLFFFSDSQNGATIGLYTFLVMMAISHICQAIGGPAWVSWMADLVPDKVRGAYFGRRRQLGFFTQIPCAYLAGFLLDWLVPSGDTGSTLRWCGIIFLVSTAFGVVDIVLFHWVPDVPPRRAGSTSMWVTLVRPLKDRNFLWFCAYIATLWFAVVPMGQFATLYLIEELDFKSRDVQLMLLVAPMLGQFFVTPIWGRMADRIGRKPMLALSSLLLVPVGFGWAMMNFGHIWLGYVLAVTGAMLWVAIEIANFNLVLEMSGSGEIRDQRSEGRGQSDDDSELTSDSRSLTSGSRGSGYTSVNSVILAIAGTLGGLGAGWLMTSLKHVEFTLGFESLARPFGNYEILFAASAVIRLIATLTLLPRVHEPEAGTTREAIEFMTDNLYDNVRGVVFEPVKRFLVRGR